MANPYIDALAGTSWLAAGFDNHITYAFDDSGLRAWSFTEKADFRAALQSWANVANITFEEVAATQNPEMREFIDSVADIQSFTHDSTIAFHTYPSATGQTVGLFGVPTGFITIGQPSGVDYATFVHEIGHALGIAHPHDTAQGTTVFPGVVNYSDLGDFGLNQDIYTVMSYNRFDRFSRTSPSGPMAFDIAAVQQLYGANESFHAGDDVYSIDLFRSQGMYICIWDAGGVDTIFGSDRFVGDTIDLRPATLEPGDGAGGFTSTNIYRIARGVTIENAVGGIGDDTIFGNDAANVLKGGTGGDKLYGGGGNDVLIGGLGKDKMTGGAGRDTFDFNALNETDKSKAATRDVITDFKHAQDKIDLFDIDAKKGTAKNDAFKFIGAADFHHVKGELHYVKRDLAGKTNDKTLVEGDVNGDGLADFQIELKGLIHLTKGDFVL